MAWFRGDCHTHSARSSGGELTPAQVVAAAREFGLDFLAATEHGTDENFADWAATGFPVLRGRENITPDGHWLDIEGRLRVVAHPHAPYPGGTFTLPPDGFDLVEVWNGAWRSDVPWQADNEAALAGWLLDPLTRPAVGDSDIHRAGQIGVAHTVVRADRCTPGAILDGLAAGRSWITDSASTELTFEARRGDHVAQIGDTLPPGDGEPELTVDVRGVPGARVELHRTDAYALVEVRHPDGRMAALTNAIRLSETRG
ncbi:PHP-associated domain-containing protein [Actinoplanes sp. NPDC049265]|uniref:PHP-associated domain-containing protein n=1 Tax=Actinoplanes sp. NPDC049265 TaxID=3363902 RepID=UPI00370F9658